MAKGLRLIQPTVISCLVASLCGCTVIKNGGRGGSVTVTINGVDGAIGSNQASETVQKRFISEHVTTIKAQTESGSITVRPVEDGTDEIHIAATKTVHGSDSTDTLKSLLPSISVQAELIDGTLVLSSKHPVDFGAHHRSVSVDYVVTAPPRLAVDLRSGTGVIKMSGLKGGGTLHTDYGNIEVKDGAGRLDLSSSSGTITLLRAMDAENIVAKSDYGSIDLQQVAGTVQAETSSGSLTVSNAQRAISLKLHSDYGKVTVVDVAGSVQASSSSGAVSLRNARITERLTMHSDYGNVEASGVTCSSPNLKVELTAQSGSVSYSGDASELTLKSDYGAVSGDLTSHLTLMAANLHSSSGSVELTVPASVSAAVVASTSSGTVGIPEGVSNSVDGNGAHKTVTLGGGSAPIKLESEYGNVNLKTR